MSRVLLIKSSDGVCVYDITPQDGYSSRDMQVLAHFAYLKKVNRLGILTFNPAHVTETLKDHMQALVQKHGWMTPEQRLKHTVRLQPTAAFNIYGREGLEKIVQYCAGDESLVVDGVESPL